MAVINFPDSPSDGATQTVGGITYTYSSSKGYWTSTASSGGGGGGGASVTTDDTAPSSPSDGDLWYDTDDGGMFVYYEDTDSSQWVEVIGSQGSPGADGADGAAGADGGAGVASVYATIDLLPLSGNTQGDMAHVTANNTLYFWNGSGWYKIALINTNPSISGVASSYDLATDGTATTVTITASDPEGLPITYSIASDTSGNIATVAQGTGASTNVFTITPTTNIANGGTFSLTFRASDGVNVATAPATFTLQFQVANSNYTTALITTAGSAGTNSTFTDSSSNSHSITANGNTTQASFSPYRSGGYSLYCNGSGGDYTKTDTSADFAFGSSDFTVECWYYPVSKAQNYPRILHFGEYWSNNNAWGLLDRHNSINTKFTVQSFALGTILESTTTVSNNQWYHLAVVRNGSTITLYVDGAAEDTYDISTNNYPDASSTSYLSLLNVSNGPNLSEAQANAYLRDVRVVKGTAVYTSAFTPTEEPLAAVSNTKFLMGSVPYLFDSSTSAHTFTQTTGGDYSTQPFGPYDYQEYAVGDHGGSAYFDGTGDYLLSTGESFDTGDFAVEAWLYPTAVGSSDKCWFDSRDTNTSNGMVLFINSSGQLSCYSSGSLRLTSSKALKPNTWHHVAFVRNNGTIYWFIDGSLSNSASYSSIIAAPGGFKIGARNDTAANFIGYISNFRAVKGTAVYTSAFTPPTAPLTAITNTSLLLDMQGAKVLDKSQSVTNLTLAGDTTASTAQYKYLPTSIYFDGNDYLNVEDSRGFAGGEDWTIESWVWLDFSQTKETLINFIPHHTIVISLNRTGSGDTYIFLGNGSSWLGAPAITSSSNLSAQTWHHVALVNNSGTITLYHDGTSVGSTTTQPSGFNTGYNLGTITGYTTERLKGYLSDFRISQGLARYTANFTPPTAALQG